MIRRTLDSRGTTWRTTISDNALERCIAIDGPTASGKSVVGRALADLLLLQAELLHLRLKFCHALADATGAVLVETLLHRGRIVLGGARSGHRADRGSCSSCGCPS